MSFISDSGYGVQSALGVNSTITPSTAFNSSGVGEQNPFPDVMCSCYSDVAGSLYFDFSVNGTDWRTFPSSGFSVTAGVHEFHTAVKGPRWCRVRWESSSLPTTLQLYTYYGTFGQPNAPLNQAYSLDSDSQLVRPSWTWLDVARGLAGGITSVKKFGRNSAVGTSFVPVCLGGVYRTPQSGAATTLRVKAGGNANDTAAGSGARGVKFTGLDDKFLLVSETVATAGASASAATTATFTRLFLLDVATSGTYATSAAGSHAGNIVIEDGAGTQDWGTIDVTGFPKSGSEIGAYTIPVGYTGYVKLRDLSIDSGKTVDCIFFSRPNCDQTTAPYSAMRARSVITGVAGGSIEAFGQTDVPFGPFVGPTDVGFMAKVASGTASVSVEFEVILIQT